MAHGAWTDPAVKQQRNLKHACGDIWHRCKLCITDMEVGRNLSPFRRLLRCADGFSYQNTVALWNQAGAWWLGYLQDITADGNSAYVEFDSTKTSARWIPTCFIWHLPFVFDNRLLVGWKNMPVWVALRDEVDGPLRFRPATLLGYAGLCRVYCVRTEIRGVNGRCPVASVEVVDRCQIVAKLPSGEMPNVPIQDGRNVLTYTKYIINFPGAESVLQEAPDVYRIITHFHKGYYELHQDVDRLSDGCRFHLKLGSKACTFVVIAQTKDIPLRQQIAESLQRVLQRHLSGRADLPPLSYRNSIAAELAWGTGDAAETSNSCPEACIWHLPHLILSEIFAYMDLQYVLQLKRVCSLWHAVITDPRTRNEHIVISVHDCIFTECVDSNNCYRVAFLLHHTVRSTTKSLTIVGPGTPDHTFFLQPWLDAADIRLPMVVIKDANFQWTNRRYDECSALKHSIMHRIRPFKDHCHTLLLHNFTVSTLFCRNLNDLLHMDYEDLVPLPDCERRWMVPRSDVLRRAHGNLLSMDTAQITLHRLILPCRNGWDEVMSRLMCAIDAQFPRSAVSADVYAKVQTVHARWVENLSYPDQWQRIRQLLNVFSGFQSDGTLLHWDALDLRKLESLWSVW
ncbi:uncharacterized protein LOC129587268 isoform X2 [Paramacrobiotus metropolitanus]|uniref:uncharacterized protein LOC129587268 isoform X2 n=1 Tax=Paramacrobiotus metropolitanus TaxID=2943436 RepID=UPI0024464563|nr:uncharacterized protein LOC129587268 isoform X2 [Paramacrobiotus metropolitanus]